ncbi:MAG: extracellular solute-binding protein [Caldilineaceae bacterium]|nr:extracellular solute-binding protein [Caldilineaceae bacterium]
MIGPQSKISGMSRRNFLRLTAVGGGALALAACMPVQQQAGSGDGDAPAGDVTMLSFLTQGGDEAAVNRYQPLIDQFQADNSDIQVEMILEPGGAIEVQTKLLTLIAAGEAPDTYWAHSYTNAGQAKRSIQLVLDDYLATDEAVKGEDFLPAAWLDFQVNGQQIGFPRETTSTVIIYNKELFDKHSLPMPTENWTWAEFLEAAATMTEGEGATKTFGTADWNLNRNTWCMMWQKGGDVLNADRTQYTMNEEVNVEIVRQIAGWHGPDGFHIPGEEKGGFTTADLFTTGRIGMFPQFSVFTGIQAAEFEWDVAHLPTDEGDTRTTRVASAGHSAYSGTEKPDAAWRFLKKLASADAFWHWVDSGLRLPSLKSVATDPKLQEPGTPPASSQIIIDAFDYGRPEPVAGDWIGVHREIQPALDSIYGIEQADAQEKLDSIADRVNELIAALPGAEGR